MSAGFIAVTLPTKNAPLAAVLYRGAGGGAGGGGGGMAEQSSVTEIEPQVKEENVTGFSGSYDVATLHMLLFPVELLSGSTPCVCCACQMAARRESALRRSRRTA